MIPPVSACGLAVDLLRSCYTTQMRFYDDPTKVVNVTWSFVGDNTPFVPYPTPFNSRNWNPDPQGDQPLGEVLGAPRVYYSGAPIGNPPATGIVCGSADQWLNGPHVPPTNPTPIDGFGIPLCCGQNVGPVLAWWSADSITNLAQGQLVHNWYDHVQGLPLRSLLAGIGPAWGTSPIYQKPSLLFFPAITSTLKLDNALVLPGPTCEAYVLTETVGLKLNGFYFGPGPDLPRSLGFWASNVALGYKDSVNAIQGPYQFTTRQGSTLQLVRDPSWIQLFGDGLPVALLANDPTGTLAFQLLGCWDPPGTGAGSRIFEVVLFSRALSAAERAQWQNYFQAKYGLNR